MLTATLTIPALGIRTRAAFLLGLGAEPTLSLAQPGDGSAVFTLTNTTAGAAQALQRLLGRYGSVKLDLVEAAPVEAVLAEVAPAEEALPPVLFRTEFEVGAAYVPAFLESIGAIDAPTPPAEPAPVEEVVVETPAVDAPPVIATDAVITGPVVVRLSMASPRVLVEQGQVLLRSLPEGSFTVKKPATGWTGTVWCIRFATVDEAALTLALEGLTCVASVWKGEDLVGSTPLPEITVEVTAEIAASVAAAEEIAPPPATPLERRGRPARA